MEGLSSLSLALGPHTTVPLVELAVSVDYEPFYVVNASEGHNAIPLTGTPSTKRDLGDEKTNSVVRINSFGWQNNRMNLEEIILNPVRLFTACMLMN